MTTKSLARICEMGRSGACLKEIAQDTGYCISTVGKWLRHQGIGPPGRKYIPRRIYTVYKTKTTEFFVEGNAKKCASFLGIKPQSFRRAYTWSHRGAPGKYTIYARDAVRMCHDNNGFQRNIGSSPETACRDREFSLFWLRA